MKNKPIDGYINHYWNGITCLRLAQILDFCVEEDIYWKGVKHIFSNEINKHDLIDVINDIYDLNLLIFPVKAVETKDRTLSTIRDDVEFPIFDIEYDLKEQKKYSL